MASNYANYIYEREGKSIIEDEFGFATFLYIGEHCYIEDIYVKPEARKFGHATKYADEITKIAQQNGYKKLLGSVNIRFAGGTQSMKVLLAYGFTLLDVEIRSNGDKFIYLEKAV